MFTPIIRILLAVFCLFLAYYEYANENYLLMVLMIATAILFSLGYFFYGTVYIAFNKVKQGKYTEAENLLLKIKYPEKLSKGQKGYYHMAKGFIELNRNSSNLAFEQFTLAHKIGLRTSNDEAIVLVNLAEISIMNEEFEDAENYLTKAKSLSHKQILTDGISRLEKRIEEGKGKIVKSKDE